MIEVIEKELFSLGSFLREEYEKAWTIILQDLGGGLYKVITPFTKCQGYCYLWGEIIM